MAVTRARLLAAVFTQMAHFIVQEQAKDCNLQELQ
jgi:hypothetical protein